MIVPSIYNYDLNHPNLALFCDDYNIVYECIQNNPDAIQYASARLRDHLSIGVLVVKKKPSLLLYLSVRLQTHPLILDIIEASIDPRVQEKEDFKMAIKLARAESNRRSYSVLL